MTLYPVSKCTPDRAVDMVEIYGPERLLVNSAGDWGPSKPTAVPDFILAMRKRGHGESLIRKVVYENPLEFFRQSRGFRFAPPEIASDVQSLEPIKHNGVGSSAARGASRLLVCRDSVFITDRVNQAQIAPCPNHSAN